MHGRGGGRRIKMIWLLHSARRWPRERHLSGGFLEISDADLADGRGLIHKRTNVQQTSDPAGPTLTVNKNVVYPTPCPAKLLSRVSSHSQCIIRISEGKKIWGPLRKAHYCTRHFHQSRRTSVVRAIQRPPSGNEPATDSPPNRPALILMRPRSG